MRDVIPRFPGMLAAGQCSLDLQELLITAPRISFHDKLLMDPLWDLERCQVCSEAFVFSRLSLYRLQARSPRQRTITGLLCEACRTTFVLFQALLAEGSIYYFSAGQLLIAS